MPTVNLVLRRHLHHARVSGYDRISEHIPARIIHRVSELGPLERVTVRALRPLQRRSGSLWYGRFDLITEVKAAGPWLGESGQIFHFLYGENSFRYLGHLKRLRRNFVVCTYHAPPGRFSEVVKDRRHLALVDAAIVVSNVLRDMLSGIVGPERVHFVPHGVDTDYFVPGDRRYDGRGRAFRALFVGSHLRDFATLAAAARLLARADPDIELEVITAERDLGHVAGLPNVMARSGVSDADLRAAYQAADLLVMPLIDATANNSLLEAMACGLPIVVTDLPGVRDYVDEHAARMVPAGAADALADAVQALKADAPARRIMSLHARERALQYGFAQVAAMTEAVYRQVVRDGGGGG